MGYIYHASISENGTSKTGAKGDQTGKEVCIRSWYKKPWDIVLRHKDKTLAAKAAVIGKKLANSNLVGYNQNQRNTLYQALKKYNWDVDAYIASGEKTNTDCSAFQYAIWCCLIPEMRSDSNAPTTSTMRKFYTKYGFSVIEEANITTNALDGDIYLKEGSHVVGYTDSKTVTTTTTAAATTTTKTKPSIATPTIKSGSKGSIAKLLQEDLNYIASAGLATDGIFGAKSVAALKKWQAASGLTSDGIYGNNSYKAMKKQIG